MFRVTAGSTSNGQPCVELQSETDITALEASVLTAKEARALAQRLGTIANQIERQAVKGAVDLAKAAHYISFEMYSFRLFTGRYTATPNDDILRRRFGPGVGAALEYSIYLHLRVLIDFFYTEPTARQDDVWVGDFRAGSEKFRKEFPDILSMPDEVTAVSATLNKRFAHFTESRWREDQPKLEFYMSACPHIAMLIQLFRVALPSPYKESFEERTIAFESRDGWLV